MTGAQAAEQPAVGVGRVVLVGAGPGDPELITVRGARELAAADVVVFDRLAPAALLEGLGEAVELVDVGKTPFHHPIPQREIEAILIDRALRGRRVVRLKGGDSFVLGRGGEEVQACRAAGIAVEVVPGVTSALSAPLAGDIPVTHRGLSKSVTIISGHEDLDYDALAAIGGTVLILMGMSRLHEISAGLIRAGRSPVTPAAVVHRAYSDAQRVVRADLAGLPMAAQGIGAPAVIVIGDVAMGLDRIAEQLPLEPVTPRSPRAS